MSNLLNIKDQSGNWIPIPVVTNGIKSITQNQDYTLTITLNDGTTYTTTSIKGEDGQDYVLTEQDKQEIARLVDTPVDDVRINSTSIVENGVATIPIANADNAGVVKVDTYENGYSGGIATIHDKLYIIGGSSKNVKNGYDYGTPIAAGNQHEATFYGLAKAAGHDEKDSTLSVGTYTDEAKASIKNMLGVEDVDIDSKAPVITETTTGSIASFDDGADDMPLQSLVVDINPVQDLHGYDSPWPAGGGKNLIENSVYVIPDTSSAEKIWTGNLNGTYTISIDKRGITSVAVPSQAAGRCTVDGVAHYLGYNTGYITVSGNLTDISIYGSSAYARMVGTLRIQLESGETATDWTPYENICPITGWTGCEVQRTGVNVWGGTQLRDDILAKVPNAVADDTNKTIRYEAVSISRKIPFDKFKSNTQYTIILKGYNTNQSFPTANITILYTDGTTEDVNKFVNDISITVTNASKSVECLRGQWASSTTYLYYNECGVFEGDISVNDFVPYTGQTYPIIFPTEAGTVYGGYIDPINGELVVDRAIFRYEEFTGNLSSDATSEYGYIRFVCVIDKKIGTTNVLSNLFQTYNTIISQKPNFEAISGFSSGTGLYLSINASRLSGDLSTAGGRAEAFKNWSRENGLEICYELAEPIHYPLASNQINSLYGQNNIFADTGNSEVTYRADSELYIDKQIPDVPVEDVQINGTSILTDGVANIPVGGNDLGVVKENLAYGIDITGQGQLLLITPSDIELKKGYAGTRRAIMTLNQHIAAFYGLAKAAGADEKDSTLPVGQYTDSAKTAIKQMLGVKDDYDSLVVEVSGTDPVITGKASYRYNCGELYTLSITPPSSGTMDIIFTSGATPTVLTLPETVKMPDWWAGIETNTTYEMCITDGTYCGVMSWAT